MARFVYLLTAALVVGTCLSHRDDWRPRWRLMTTPGVYEPVLPPGIGELIGCLKRSGVDGFNPKGDLREDFVAYQRLVEGAWPLEVSDASRVVVARKRELAAFCPTPRPLCQTEEAVVATCAL